MNPLRRLIDEWRIWRYRRAFAGKSFYAYWGDTPEELERLIAQLKNDDRRRGRERTYRTIDRTSRR